MAYTVKDAARLKEASGQKSSGRKLTKPVFTYSLSWHPEQTPDRKHMLQTAKRSIEVLGLGEHEAIIVAHRDEPQKHVHVIVSRTHPVTGLAAKMSHSKLKLSEFAHAYELEHEKIYCPQREVNQEQRRKGKKTMYRDPVICEAWARSYNGRSFVDALALKGYHLARGRRLVVVDPYGNIISPVRQLEGVKTRDFESRLQDLDLSKLPDAHAITQAKLADNRRRCDESLRYEKELSEKLERLAERQRKERGDVERSLQARVAHERNEFEEQHQVRKRSEKVTALREKVDHPKWWQRLFGITRTARRELGRLERDQNSANTRLDERVMRIETENEATLTKLAKRQAEDLRHAEDRHLALRPNRLLKNEAI